MLRTHLLDKETPSYLTSSGCQKTVSLYLPLTPLTHLPWLFLLPLTFDSPPGLLVLGGAWVALSGCPGAFLAVPSLASWSLVWLPFLGAFPLAAPGLEGTVLTSPGFLGPFLTSPGLRGSFFASLGFLGPCSLASLGLLGATMVDLFLGWILLLFLGTNWWNRE